jgi:hypothetical protein
MLPCQSRKRTAAAPDDETAIDLLGLRGSPELAIENLTSGADTRVQRTGRKGSRDLARQIATGLAHRRVELGGRLVRREQPNEVREKGDVRAREQVLQLRRELVRLCRSSGAGSNARCPHQAVALERRQLGAHGIAGYAQLRSDLIDGRPATADDANDAPSRALQKVAVKSDVAHRKQTFTRFVPK